MSVHEREVQGQMVAFEPPAPRRCRARLAEHGEVVGAWIAHVRTGAELALAEHFFESHDRCRLQQSAPSECGRQESERECTLRRAELADRDAAAVARDEVPVQALGVADVEPSAVALRRRQGGEEPPGAIAHVGRECVLAELAWARRSEARDQQQADDQTEEATHRETVADLAIRGKSFVSSHKIEIFYGPRFTMSSQSLAPAE